MERGRNDPCWCPSGKKYKKCHFESDQKLPPFPAVHDQIRRPRVRGCNHPSASPSSCSGGIIQAHTVQRSRVLKAIAGETKHVLTFHPNYGKARNPGMTPVTVGWKQASTFPGFCAHHDSTTFAPLENGEFEGTVEQCFLLAYRAVCHELSCKRTAILQYEEARKIFEGGGRRRVDPQVTEMIEMGTLGLTFGIAELEREKALMDAALLSGRFDEFEVGILTFTGAGCVVTTGSFSPDFDVDGTRIQDAFEVTVPLHAMHVAVDFDQGRPNVIFVWHRTAEPCRRYADTLFAKQATELECLVPHLFFLHLENTFFAEKWWRDCSEEMKKRIATLYMTIVAEDVTVAGLSTTPLVPWAFAGARRL